MHPISAPYALFQRIEASFQRQGMMRHLAARLGDVAPGFCEVFLPYSDRVTQQQGGFHGGAMGALADIAGGYAGLSVAPEEGQPWHMPRKRSLTFWPCTSTSSMDARLPAPR